MAKKNKKVPDKLRLYYRGQVKTPTRIASESVSQIISDAIKDCAPKRLTTAFVSKWVDQKLNVIEGFRFKLLVGLAQSLRSLKQKRTKAVIFDSRINEHLIKYLIDFAQGLGAPSVQVDNLSKLVPGFKSLLAVSIVPADELDHSIYREKDPKPKKLDETSESEAFNKLIDLLIEDVKIMYDKKGRLKFEAPKLELVPPIGKRKLKKEAKLASKKSKLASGELNENKRT